MKRRLNVLSIDFDYFQKVDNETLQTYPDGIDLGTEISKVVWAGHYANPHDAEKLLKVEADTVKIERVKRVIYDSYSPLTKVLICNSHRHIYDMIHGMYDSDIYEGVDIYNVDMHPDMFNNNFSVDCGNWISFILDEIPGSTITWIANPASLKGGFSYDESKFDKITEDLSEIEYIDYDIVFLCRSDIWTPPHLDSYFTDLSYDIVEIYEDALIEDGILDIRDCSELIAQMYVMNKRGGVLKNGKDIQDRGKS